MEFKENLLTRMGINLTNDQMILFERYFEKLIEFNTHTNLTSITEKEDVYYKHFYDSLTIAEFIEDGKSLCDMGSGAGFPSIPLKIIYPSLKVTIIDSSNKRIRFLKELIELLELSGVEVVHSRIEDFGIANQERFDYVTARALGNLTLITEFALPMLKINGEFIAMKGSKGKYELNEATNAIRITGGILSKEVSLELPKEYGSRMLYIIKKDTHIKGYPRNYQEMLKNPL